MGHPKRYVYNGLATRGSPNHTIFNVLELSNAQTLLFVWFWSPRAPKPYYFLGFGALELPNDSMFIICGAHVVDNYKHSITAAAYLATLMSTTWTGKVTSNILEELPFYDYTNLLAASRLYCMILFTIPFQVLSALDRGIQIQRWPLPIILGATYGFVLGTMVGVFLLGAQNRQKNRRTKD